VRRLSSERKELPVNLLYAFTHHTGARLAEVGFLFILFSGVWFAAAQMPGMRFGGGRTTVAGLALAVGAALLIVATHWGRFG
jgi:hypothetical protein